MSESSSYVLITGEPFLSRVKDYREKREACLAAWRAFAQEKGATSIPETLTGLCFPGKAPEGWTRITRKSGFSCPKIDHSDYVRMKALPPMPSNYAVFGDALVYAVSYSSGPDCNGTWTIGPFLGPSIGWAGDTFFAYIPDAHKAVLHHLAQYPNDKIEGDALDWKLPKGLQFISEAQCDLIVAQYKVSLENSAARVL